MALVRLVDASQARDVLARRATAEIPDRPPELAGTQRPEFPNELRDGCLALRSTPPEEPSSSTRAPSVTASVPVRRFGRKVCRRSETVVECGEKPELPLPGPTTMRDHGAAAAGEDDWCTLPVARAFHTPPGGLGGVYAPRRGVNVRVK